MGTGKFKVVIIGAGSGGISLAAKLSSSIDAKSIAIIDPATYHYYQPLWTLVGAGLVSKSETQKEMAGLIPNGVTWIKDAVNIINPETKKVEISGGQEIEYEYLVVATGLVLNWEKIQNLKESLGKNGICSVYEVDQAERTAEMIQNFQGGKAIFIMPPVPIKCAGAPQKIMYLADNVFRNRGIRHKTEIIFATAGKAMFGIPTFANALDKIIKEKDIHPLFSHKLIAVNPKKKVATFEITDANGQISQQNISYDLIHVVPTMSAHPFLSNLAWQTGEQKGWLEVDKFTLQHLKYPNIFGIGDVTGIPNAKTGAAIRVQYPIVAQNLISVMNGQAPMAKYNGYSSCPLVTEIGKVMLAEFGYDGKLLPTFPLDPSIPRKSYWILKRYLLPKIYWYGMLKGLM